MLSSKAFVRLSILGSIGLMALGFIAGSFLIPTTAPNCTASARTMSDIFIGCTNAGLPVMLVKVMTILALLVPVIWFAQAMMGLSFKELREQMWTDDGNDSPALLIMLGLFAMSILANAIAFTSPFHYLATLLWRLGIVILMTNLFAALVLTMVTGLTSFAMLDKKFQEPGTNTAALVIGVSLMLSALIV